MALTRTVSSTETTTESYQPINVTPPPHPPAGGRTPSHLNTHGDGPSGAPIDKFDFTAWKKKYTTDTNQNRSINPST
eukprot:3920794-Prymnesium_polylepis.1